MKIFGYKNKQDDEIIEMSEITLQIDLKTTRSLALFFNQCVSNMEADGDWEHAHFREFEEYSEQNNNVDLIVFREN